MHQVPNHCNQLLWIQILFFITEAFVIRSWDERFIHARTINLRAISVLVVQVTTMWNDVRVQVQVGCCSIVLAIEGANQVLINALKEKVEVTCVHVPSTYRCGNGRHDCSQEKIHPDSHMYSILPSDVGVERCIIPHAYQSGHSIRCHA